LVNFLNTDEKGNTLLFDSTKQKEKIESLATIIMTLPEYILNSGITKQSDNNTDTSFLNSTNSKIIFVDLPGGYDYLNNFISKKNYTDMQTLRPTINRKANELVDV
jgi:translation elongation factor EF-Tu-like GTPase